MAGTALTRVPTVFGTHDNVCWTVAVLRLTVGIVRAKADFCDCFVSTDSLSSDSEANLNLN